MSVLGAGEEAEGAGTAKLREEEATNEAETQGREGCWGEARLSARRYFSNQVLRWLCLRCYWVVMDFGEILGVKFGFYFGECLGCNGFY